MQITSWIVSSGSSRQHQPQSQGSEMIETDFNEAQWCVCQPRPGDWTDRRNHISRDHAPRHSDMQPRHYQSSQWADVLRVAWSFPSQNIDRVSVRPRLMREIPWQSFLVDEQVDVYYFFLLSLRRTCHHVYLQTRNSKTSPDIQSQNRECQCQLNCLSDILLWTDILCELPVYYSGDEYYSLLSM